MTFVDIIQNILIVILFFLWWNIEHLKGEVVHTEMSPEEFKEFIEGKFKDKE